MAETSTAVLPDRSETVDAYFFPEASSRERWIALSLILLSCLYLRIFYHYSALNADEGIVLQGAQRILQGQVLYRDFFSYFTPGSYYWMALLFKLFGSSILVGRAALIVYGGLFSALTYLIARRVCARWSALLACYAVLLTCLPFRFVVLHNWDSTLLAYLTLYCALLVFERGGRAWAVAAGSFAALTILFEHSKGVGLVLGLLCGYLLIAWRSRTWSLLDAGQLAGLALGFGWPFLATFSYFALEHSTVAMLSSWAWPMFHYTGANRLPYGFLVMSTPDRTELLAGPWSMKLATLVTLGPCILLPILPAIALAILLHFGFRGGRSEHLDPRSTYWILISATLTGLVASTFLTKRADFTHLNYLGPLFYLVLAWMLGGPGSFSRLWRYLQPIVALCAFFCVTGFGMAMLWGPLGAHHISRTVRGEIKTVGSDGPLEFLQANVRPGEEMLIYPYEPLYYYLTGTFSAIRLEYLQPGMHTADQFRQAALELSAKRPRVVLFEPTFREKVPLGWPNTPLATLVAPDPVQEYIFAHYRPCAALSSNDFWHFVYMVRNDNACPPTGQ